MNRQEKAKAKTTQKTQGTQGTEGTKRTSTANAAPDNPPSFRSFRSFQSFKSSPPPPPSPSPPPSGFIPAHGGYQKLLSYQKSEIVFDGTVRFCQRFIDKRDRTYDQMIQAARSGKQNIAEGSMASGTSKETEIKLTAVARSSLEELRLDYLDFLRNRGLEPWPADHPYALRLRDLSRRPNGSYETFRKGIEHHDPVICANVMIGLICVTSFLLKRQLERLEEDFLNQGGIRERMRRARVARRGAFP